MKVQPPNIEYHYWFRDQYDPDTFVIRESVSDGSEPRRFEIYISKYVKGASTLWRVRFLHIRISGLESRQLSIEAGKSLVQAYLQGTYDQ